MGLSSSMAQRDGDLLGLRQHQPWGGGAVEVKVAYATSRGIVGIQLSADLKNKTPSTNLSPPLQQRKAPGRIKNFPQKLPKTSILGTKTMHEEWAKLFLCL